MWPAPTKGVKSHWGQCESLGQIRSELRSLCPLLDCPTSTDQNVLIWQRNVDQTQDCLCVFCQVQGLWLNISNDITLHSLPHRLPWKQSKMATKHFFFKAYNFLSVGNKLILFFCMSLRHRLAVCFVRICVCHTYNNFNKNKFKCRPNNQEPYHSNTHNTKSFTRVSKS